MQNRFHKLTLYSMVFVAMLWTFSAQATQKILSSSKIDKNGLQILVRMDKDSYKLGSSIRFQVLLTNVSKNYPGKFYIYRLIDLGESSSLSIWIKNAVTHKDIPRDFIYDDVPPPPPREAFIELLPGYIYGTSFNLPLSQLGVTKPGEYELLIYYHSPVSKQFTHGLLVWTSELGTLKAKPVTFLVTN